MRQGGVDISEILADARVEVNQQTQGAQIPWSAGKLSAPYFLFERAADAPAAKRAAAPSKPLKQLSAAEAYQTVIARDRLSDYEAFLRDHRRSEQAKRIEAILAARREALFWRRALDANNPRGYWTYLRRYPHGPHAFDAGRALDALAARREPPPDFAVIEYEDLPPPPPDEFVYADRPVYYFGGDDYGPPPPRPPAYVVEYDDDDWRDLPPPPPPTLAGVLPTLAIAIPLLITARAFHGRPDRDGRAPRSAPPPDRRPIGPPALPHGVTVSATPAPAPTRAPPGTAPGQVKFVAPPKATPGGRPPAPTRTIGAPPLPGASPTPGASPGASPTPQPTDLRKPPPTPGATPAPSPTPQPTNLRKPLPTPGATPAPSPTPQPTPGASPGTGATPQPSNGRKPLPTTLRAPNSGTEPDAATDQRPQAAADPGHDPGRENAAGDCAQAWENANAREAADPGVIGLVFEPVQGRRQMGGRDQIFPAVVEAAAMHRPQLAGHAGRQAVALFQMIVQPHEIEGRADPGDARDHMQPAQRQLDPGMTSTLMSQRACFVLIGSAARRADASSTSSNSAAIATAITCGSLDARPISPMGQVSARQCGARDAVGDQPLLEPGALGGRSDQAAIGEVAARQHGAGQIVIQRMALGEDRARRPRAGRRVSVRRDRR